MKNLTSYLFAAILIFSSASRLGALEVTPSLHEKRLSLKISKVDYPSTLAADLRSGLTVRIVVNCRLMAGEQTIDESITNIAIRYDLWEELFFVSRFNKWLKEIVRIKALDTLLEQLSNITIERAFDDSATPRDRVMRTYVDILYNPVEAERAKNLQEWVVRNSTTVPSTATNLNSARGNSTFFAKIFSQYGDNKSPISPHRINAQSQEFRWSDLKNESTNNN